MNRGSGRIWINFKELRTKLRFEEILSYYKIEVRRRGDQHQGPCPLPNHLAGGPTNSFSVNLGRGIFQCFGCKAKGNVLEFAALMEGVDPENGAALREVAVKLQTQVLSRDQKPDENPKGDFKATPPPERPKQSAAKVQINPPLDFELKELDAGHEWFKRRNVDPVTIAGFGAGYCNRGMLKGRIAIPLHDPSGRLIGYAGIAADETTVAGKQGSYVFPSERERDGVVRQFNKNLFLYNGHRIPKPCEDLVLTAFFESVWFLNQNGIENAVATMGDEPSPIQLDLVLAMVPEYGRIWIAPDGSKDGDAFARMALSYLSPRRFVRWVKMDQGVRLPEVSSAEVKQRFGF